MKLLKYMYITIGITELKKCHLGEICGFIVINCKLLLTTPLSHHITKFVTLEQTISFPIIQF